MNLSSSSLTGARAGPPPTRPPPSSPQGPPVPTRPALTPVKDDELRFIPSPPLRDPVKPPLSVFLTEDDQDDSTSVFLPPTTRPTQNFPNTFFNVQTQLGQTQTRIPPSSSSSSQ